MLREASCCHQSTLLADLAAIRMPDCVFDLFPYKNNVVASKVIKLC